MASKTARQGRGAASGNEEEGVRGRGPSKGHGYGLEGPSRGEDDVKDGFSHQVRPHRPTRLVNAARRCFFLDGLGTGTQQSG